ncbi:hypothetical protein [Pacificibacter maritimus]|uniref:hypothetical protein n=1 Tax=Pacificibacter maritimus TaxID=762213 RepID=UPI000F4D3667|nr:hypothetical protein [Pacificibacter maritimus]
MEESEAHKAELEAQRAALPDQGPIVLHPTLAKTYRGKIAALSDNLNDEACRFEASELLRGLISAIRMLPDETALNGQRIKLVGELAAILELSPPQKREHPLFYGRGVGYVVLGVMFRPSDPSVCLDACWSAIGRVQSPA